MNILHCFWSLILISSTITCMDLPIPKDEAERCDQVQHLFKLGRFDENERKMLLDSSISKEERARRALIRALSASGKLEEQERKLLEEKKEINDLIIDSAQFYQINGLLIAARHKRNYLAAKLFLEDEDIDMVFGIRQAYVSEAKKYVAYAKGIVYLKALNDDSGFSSDEKQSPLKLHLGYQIVGPYSGNMALFTANQRSLVISTNGDLMGVLSHL